MNRIVGLETEYGCLTSTPAGSFIAVERVRDWIFGREEYGLIDVHHRDWDEPPGNGGFLFNGGRVYIDMGHLEYCTPECTSLLDVLRYDRAGRRAGACGRSRRWAWRRGQFHPQQHRPLHRRDLRLP